MYTEMSLKEALKYFMKGRKVLVLNEYDDKSISAERIEDCLPKEAKYLVDVPAVQNLEFEQAVQDMVEPDQNENTDQPEKKLEKETVAAPGKMSREEKSKIIRPLLKKGLKNKEIAERTGIPLGTVNGLSGSIRKELKNPAKVEMIKSGDNSDCHKCRTCQYRHSDAGGCDYCIHTGRERGCDVEVCDKAVAGPRLTRK